MDIVCKISDPSLVYINKTRRSAAARLKSIFEILRELLSEINTDPELVLAHLNSLLTEINAAYFSTDKSPADGRLSNDPEYFSRSFKKATGKTIAMFVQDLSGN